MAAHTKRPNKRNSPGTNQIGAWIFLGLTGTVLVVIFAAFAAAWVTGTGHGSLPGWVTAAGGGPRWSSAATWVLVLVLLIAVVLFGPLRFLAWRQWRRKEWTDVLAKDMHSRRDLKEITAKAATKDAQRLGSLHAGIGLPLGKAVLTHQSVFGLYEWSQVWIMGTRAGKSRSVAVPQIMTHRGPVISTSNKPDVWGWTNGPRSELGRVWAQDPQQIARQNATWLWDPITFVKSVERAEKLVDVWAAARTVGDMAGLDPYFEPEGRKLMSSMVLAARVGGEYVTRLPDWTTGLPPAAGVPDPAELLDAAGLDMVAKDVRAWWALPDDQRAGVFGTARSYLSFLRDPRFVTWMVPDGPADPRPVLDPDAFVRSTDTLYLLSKEGPGSARALTAGLTVAVYTAAEDVAEEHGGRVPTPVLFLLDEAANVCRWPELPSLYSHAGGKGIILVTIIQSRVQGQNAWGPDQFEMMWSAANCASAGRGLNDARHVADLASLIGDRQILSFSRSTGTKGHRSTSRQNQDERIFSEADLRSFPRGRAVLLASGARAILLALQDYSQHEWAWKCDASAESFRAETQIDIAQADGGAAAAYGGMLEPLTDAQLAAHRARSAPATSDVDLDQLAVAAERERVELSVNQLREQEQVRVGVGRFSRRTLETVEERQEDQS